MEYRYKPEGVCSREMIFDIDGDIVRSVKIVGGCARKYCWNFAFSKRYENKRCNKKIKRNTMWI